MSSIAFDLPDDIIAIREAITAFVKREVLPRHERHASLLDDPRARYAADGRYSEAVYDIIREVRMASSEAGFFNMCVPTAIGGGGLGHLAYFVAWQAVYHTCGTRSFLAPYTIAHWAFAASPVLEQVSAEVRERMLPDLLSGRRSMCFGLSEPGAGSDASMIKTRAVADGRRLAPHRSQTVDQQFTPCRLLHRVRGHRCRPRPLRTKAAFPLF